MKGKGNVLAVIGHKPNVGPLVYHEINFEDGNNCFWILIKSGSNKGKQGKCGKITGMAEFHLNVDHGFLNCNQGKLIRLRANSLLYIAEYLGNKSIIVIVSTFTSLKTYIRIIKFCQINFF